MMDLGIPAGHLPWEEMNPDTNVMYAPDPHAINDFSLKKSPIFPRSLQPLTRRTHIYSLEAEYDFSATLWTYISGLEPGTQIEIWNLWDGYDFRSEPIAARHLSRSALNLSDLEWPINENVCLSIR